MLATDNRTTGLMDSQSDVEPSPDHVAEDNNANSSSRSEADRRESEATAEELIVLDPDHPLMRRFQECLKNMIMKHLESAEVLLREKDEAYRREKAAHVETGCELYSFQQELAKFQGQLEKKHAEYNAAKEKAKATEKALQDIRQEYRECADGLAKDRKRMETMRDEMDSMSLRLFYLNNAKSEIEGDIKVLKRAAEKCSTDLTKFEQEKLLQDMLINRIQAKVDQLREDVAMYEAQITAQESELEASQALLHEAEAQIVSISVDRKQLHNQWNTSLLGLQRRNEAYAELMKAHEALKERLIVLENEQAAYRQSIGKQQENHEQLTLLINKNEADLNTVKKQILQAESKLEADKQSYATLTRMLQETEKNLASAQTDLKTCTTELEVVRKQVEKQNRQKVELENKIAAELRDKLTAKKAMEYVNKLNLLVQDQSRELLTQIAQLENQIARDELAVAKKKAENEELQERIDEVERQISERNNLINKIETEIHHATLMVERKQSGIDQLNKKLEALMKESGGQEVGPLEATINNLTKAVQAKQSEIEELEQDWLKEQNDLIKYVNERDTLARDVERLEKQLTIMAQKKLRIDHEIETQTREKHELERELKHLQHDTVRLNALIAKEKVAGSNLSSENKLAETDFVRALREKETELAELQSKVDEATKAREDMLNELVEVERSIMLWEKKVQLCEETRHAVECDLGQGELKVMRHEIHRMEMRKASLIQQQEKLLQALERSVVKRDMIILQSETKISQKNQAQMRITLQRQLEDLRKKLRATKRVSSTCNEEMKQLEEQLQGLESQVKEKRTEFEGQQKMIEELTDQLQDLVDEKHKNLFEIQMKQHETLYWEQVREGRYQRLCTSSKALTAESSRQLDRIRSLLLIIDQLVADYPQVQRDLLPVRNILNSRLVADPAKPRTPKMASDPIKDTRKTSKTQFTSK